LALFPYLSQFRVNPLAFIALTLLLGWQEGHAACTKWVVR